MVPLAVPLKNRGGLDVSRCHRRYQHRNINGVQVSKRDKLLRAARNNPGNLRFAELCRLAENYGFVFARQGGSHAVYKRPGHMGVMTFQDDGGKAKGYQVKQLLAAIDELESNN